MHMLFSSDLVFFATARESVVILREAAFNVVTTVRATFAGNFSNAVRTNVLQWSSLSKIVNVIVRVAHDSINVSVELIVVEINRSEVGQIEHRAWEGSRKAIARDVQLVQFHKVGYLGRKCPTEIIVGWKEK